jgi:hypothetical protein
MISQFVSTDGKIRLNVEDRVWVSSGGVGWSRGEVLSFRTNRDDQTIVKVGYVAPLPSGVWVREGERKPEQIRPRDPFKMGKDKPPSRDVRRKRCKGCGVLGGHLGPGSVAVCERRTA